MSLNSHEREASALAERSSQRSLCALAMNEPLFSLVIPGLLLAISLHASEASAPSFVVREVVGATTPDAEPFTLKYPKGQETLHLARAHLLDSSMVRQAAVEKDALGYFHVRITLTPAGAQRLAEFTTSHAGTRIAILVEGRIVSAPFAHGPFTGGDFEITGNYSEAEAHELVRKINEAIHSGGA